MKKASADLWHDLVQTHTRLIELEAEFSMLGESRIPVLRDALRSRERTTALWLAPSLGAHELNAIWPELLEVATFNDGAYWQVLQIVNARLGDIRLDQSQSVLESLATAAYTESDLRVFRNILELALALDAQTARTLANKALTHSDIDFREAGQDYLDKLSGR